MKSLWLHFSVYKMEELTAMALMSDSWPENVCLHIPSLMSHICHSHTTTAAS